jgi:hypothetical protein
MTSDAERSVYVSESMRSKNVLVFVAVVAAFVLASVAGAAAAGVALHVKLLGPNVVPRGDPNGVGEAALTLDARKQQLCWKFTGLAGIGKPSVARISKGSKGKTGPVVLSLGRSYKSSSCVTAPTRLLTAIIKRPSAYYLTVWAGPKYKAGVIRGQL